MLAVERRESARKLSNLKQSRLEENIWRESQQGTEVDGRAKCLRNGVESRGIRYHVASHFRKQPASALEQKEGFLREHARMFDYGTSKLRMLRIQRRKASTSFLLRYGGENQVATTRYDYASAEHTFLLGLS